MGLNRCFCSSWKKKKKKVEGENSYQNKDNVRTLSVKLENQQKSSEMVEFRSSIVNVSVPFHFPEKSVCNIKVSDIDSPLAFDSKDVFYEGEDEMEDALQMRRNDSDQVDETGEEIHSYFSFRKDVNDKAQSEDEEGLEMLESGHVSDPGMVKAEFWTSPKLKRSCSDLAVRNVCDEVFEQKNLVTSKSYENMQLLADKYKAEGDGVSPVTVMTHKSADKVMLKKHSSSQILPSRSKRLWWKLFMWSHRNLYRAGTVKAQPVAVNLAVNLQGGYSSDTLERRRGKESSKLDEGDCNYNNQKWDEIHGVSGMWPQNQWIAFPSQSSPFSRVDEWVKEIPEQPSLQGENFDNMENYIFFPSSPDNVRAGILFESVWLDNLT